jgi:hypothetical protein
LFIFDNAEAPELAQPAPARPEVEGGLYGRGDGSTAGTGTSSPTRRSLGTTANGRRSANNGNTLSAGNNASPVA